MSAEKLVRQLRGELDDAGLRGSVLVRDLHADDEIGIEPDLVFPIASLVKIPLAVATLERVRAGELDGARRIEVQPGRIPGAAPTGVSKFRHPAVIAVDDLLYLSMSVSDNAAADALFELTPPAQVTSILGRLGICGINVRHPLRDLTDTPAERFDDGDADLAQAIAIAAGTGGRGHRIPQLDITEANAGSARAFVDLLQQLWMPSSIAPEVRARVRELMAANVIRHRLAPDFVADASTWSSKTGTLLNLRHEVGVVEHADGQVFAVAVLTESRIAAITQPAAEAVMARVARRLRDEIRSGWAHVRSSHGETSAERHASASRVEEW
ncbi:serine hydrolase [Phytoactinopolyspora halotolerans]|uniref:Serine hydrolase n=1 Tax=Phytoactinopolyspora halotolerans TaxID=1981512 RepID=A0A6L9SGR0_9ACTN|nr:serine hydrolase [Phytoactinopolyspora halotolerans]NEE03551.1 serine hydrolase [Phytoactinopolyspora halotolerans]